MFYLPYGYEQINLQAGINSPSVEKDYNNKTYWYWYRALLQRLQSTLIFNLPDDWQGSVKDFFLYCLYTVGFVGVFDDPAFGKVFQPGTLSGYDFFYQPTKFIISNPLLSKEFEIGNDCELIKLSPDYRGAVDIIDRFARQLSELDNAVNMSIVNSKLAFLIVAKNKSAAIALKAALDEVNKGKPAVVLDKIVRDADKDDPLIQLMFDVKSNYILTDLLRDLQTILNNFDCEIGIPTIPYEKKERMVTDEANSRIVDSTSRSALWLETLKSSIDIVNKKFGLNISVEPRFDTDDTREGEYDAEQDYTDRIS